MDDPASLYAAALSERLSRVQQQRDALAAAIDETRLARSLTFSDDEHDPDGSLASLDQARDTALLLQADATLAELGEARRRLAAGNFDVCENCGREIGTQRLLARPETRICLACARRAKARPRRIR